MSIIPYNYAANREVVLIPEAEQLVYPSSRHNNAVVVYDPESKRLALRDVSHGELELGNCPYCGHPRQREQDQHGQKSRTSSPGVAAGFVNPEYFRMLHESLPASDDEDPSSPPSPRRRLVQTAEAGWSSTVTADQDASSPSTSAGISATAFSQGYFKRFFVEEQELGRGGKGVVLLVKHVLDGVTLGHFACKRVPVGDDHGWLEKVLVEVQLLQYLSHQHLVSYRHVWLEDIKLSNFGPSVPCAFILQQYCNAGDLHKYILDQLPDSSDGIHQNQWKSRTRRRSHHQPIQSEEYRGRKLQFEEIYSFFKDIASGLNHLHVNGYIHRDLKPSNCLLHDSGKGLLRVLVSDFGEVQVANMVQVLRRNEFGALGNFTTKSDIFSLGMILYFLCFSRLPYRHADNLHEENEDLEQLRDEITTWSGLHEERKLRPDLPEKLYTFLRRLLSLDPIDRPSAEEILHGIKTGSGLDKIADARPPSSGQIFEDLRNTSRISPIDSPQTTTPRPQSPTRRQSISLARSRGPANLRLSAFQGMKAQESPLEDDDSASSTPASPNGSLVLREPFPSPVQPRKNIPQLPAPPNPAGSRLRYIGSPGATTTRNLKLVILLLKVVTVNAVCNPVAPNPAVAYALLALAALDPCLDGHGFGPSAGLVAVHLTLLVLSSRSGYMCRSTASVWGVL
ncbi:MAG: hypothetical protein Q9190_004115 [Brigantiaea leucoxantha]